MPHLATKREAKLGEVVLWKPNSSIATLGIIVAIQPAERCNASLLPLARRWNSEGGFFQVVQAYPDCVSLDECHPVEA